MKDLMLDIETLGNGKTPVILSISAVQFDAYTGETGKEFNVNIDAESAQIHGCQLDTSTVLWWMGQSDKAREAIINRPYQVGLMFALDRFNNFITDLEHDEQEELRLWGRSPRFDCGRIESVMKLLKMEPSWNFREERDVRTIAGFKPGIEKETPFEGVKHIGIDDCKHQIKYVSILYRIMYDAVEKGFQNEL